MKLVGATDWFIRWPFVIEGVIVGAAGRGAGDRRAGRDQGRGCSIRWPADWTLIAAPRTIPFTALVIVLVGGWDAVSALGSGLSLRRFLRV